AYGRSVPPLAGGDRHSPDDGGARGRGITDGGGGLMDVLVLNGEEVTRLLPMRDCIQVMRDALAALARGEALVPLRMIMRVRGASGFVGVMPGYIAPGERRDGALGLKAVLVFPANVKRGIDTHQGAVLLFESDPDRLSALLDGGAITAIRTAAVSGLATDLLARAD